MTTRGSKRLPITLTVLVAFIALSCGQKPGVADLPAPGAQAGQQNLVLPPGTELDAAGNLIDSETGEVIASADELAAANAALALGDRGGPAADASGPASGPSSGRTADASRGEGAGSGAEAGITKSAIKIGVHAPITGAAPIPAASFEKGVRLYWDHMRRIGESVDGRDVVTTFRNDNYNPSQAVSACREMVEDEGVFLLMGLAGTDQIQACARYAESVGVPYLSTGVTELALDRLRHYFAFSMSYKQQGPLLADMLVDMLGARRERNGMLRFNTPNFQDAHDSWVAAMRKIGAPVQYDRAVSRTAGQSEAAALATELNQQGIENVYVLTSPTFFIQLANAAANQNYKPQWVGVGLSMSLDTVANVACRNSRSIDNARFLNFFPAFVDSPRFDPDFRQAGGTDDIQFALWGISKVVRGMLEAPGREVTRQRFIHANESGTNISTGVLPPVRYTEQSHFGAHSMHLSRADCGNNRWVTERAFVKDF